ncbi:hypothetical protein SISSUDRAFT_970853, partial [Sistotremastrum suecicum HHB10207 ss-3]
SFKLELPSVLKQKGVHDVFHASLLRIHYPNDDRRFPGRAPEQIISTFGEHSDDWAVGKILAHRGKGTEAEFEVLYKTGDKT